MVEGLSTGADPAPLIYLSPRGARTGAELASRFDNVGICDSNQEVAERAAVLVVAVRPEDATEVLSGIRLHDDSVVISVMAGVSHATLAGLVGSSRPVVRAIPLPAVRHRRSSTLTYPANESAASLFDRLGGSLPVADEDSFAALSAVSGTVTGYLQYLSLIAAWASRHGVDADQAERYVRSIFADLGDALADPDRSLAQLLRDHETPGGFNEQFRRNWLAEQNADALGEVLDTLLVRLAVSPGSRSRTPG